MELLLNADVFAPEPRGILHLHVGDGKRGLAPIVRALAEAEIPARVYQPTHVNRQVGLFEEALLLAGRGCLIDVTAFPQGENEGGLSAVDRHGRGHAGHPG